LPKLWDVHAIEALTHQETCDYLFDLYKHEKVCISGKSATSYQLHNPGQIFQKDAGFHDKNIDEKLKS
jgi:hypothetical protein